MHALASELVLFESIKTVVPKVHSSALHRSVAFVRRARVILLAAQLCVDRSKTSQILLLDGGRNFLRSAQRLKDMSLSTHNPLHSLRGNCRCLSNAMQPRFVLEVCCKQKAFGGVLTG